MNQFDALDAFMEKARSAADAATKKTNDLVQLSRLKLEASQIQNDIDREYKRLGIAVYQMINDNEMDRDRMDSFCKKIALLLYNLKTTEEQINTLKKTIPCPACGHLNPSKSSYCSQCGEKLHSDDQPEPDEFDQPI